MDKQSAALTNFITEGGIDLTLEALKLAEELYKVRDILNNQEKNEEGTRLAKMGVFTGGQIALILDISPTTARKRGWGKGIPANRFNPNSLGSLRVLYRKWKKEGVLSPQVVKLAHEQGCSYGMMSRLLGATSMQLYRAAERA